MMKKKAYISSKFRVVATNPTKTKQQNNFCKAEYFSSAKKTGPDQIRKHDLCRPKHGGYPQAKRTN